MSENKQCSPMDAIKKLVELGMPDLRHYYRMPKKAKVVAVYPSEDGKYYADVQPLRNDESVDTAEPVVSKVEIPVLWGGLNRGVVCPPTIGVHCDLGYYDGDPNYPHITNFRWYGMDAPAAELNEFVIQLEPGVVIKIDKKKQIVALTPENVNTEAGKNWIIKAGNNASIEADGNILVKASGGEVHIVAAGVIRLISPLIEFFGRFISRSYKGSGKGYAEFEGDMLIKGNETVSENSKTGGNSTVGKNSTVSGNASIAGNSYAGSRSGGSCPH